MGIVKSGISHVIEAGKEIMEVFQCKISGKDPKTDPYSDMHYDNAVLLLKTIHNKVNTAKPNQTKASWVDALYFRTGGMK